MLMDSEFLETVRLFLRSFQIKGFHFFFFFFVSFRETREIEGRWCSSSHEFKMKIVRVSGVTSDSILHSKILLFHPVWLLAWLVGHRKVAGQSISWLRLGRASLSQGSLFSQMWLYLLGLILVFLFPFFSSLLGTKDYYPKCIAPSSQPACFFFS